MARIEVNETIHVRYDGNTYNLLLDNLDIVDNFDDNQLIEAVSKYLSSEIGQDVDLSGYSVDRYENNGLYDIHPQAKFGY